jgi:hypothetical protein
MTGRIARSCPSDIPLSKFLAPDVSNLNSLIFNVFNGGISCELAVLN